MPIFDQGYRRYTGPVNRGSRSRAIAWESFRPRIRWYVWLLAFAFSFWPYLVYAVLAYLILVAGVPMGGRGGVPSDVIRFHGPLDPASLLSVNAASGRMFWETLNDAFANGGPVILTAVACAGILAADRRTGALQIYFARPVTRTDYVWGKVLCTCAFPALLTWLPATLLWLECVAFQGDLQYAAKTWFVPFAILSASSAYALWAAALVLLLSSLIDRPVLVATVAIFSYLFLLGFGRVMFEAMDESTWLTISPHVAIGVVTAPLFRLQVPETMPVVPCFLNAFVFPAACLWFAIRRLRAVEVVT